MKRQRIMIIRDAELRDARGIAEVHVRSWQAAYAGIVPDEDLAQLSVDEREQFLGANSLKRRTRMIIPIDAGGFPRAVVAFLTASMCCLI